MKKLLQATILAVIVCFMFQPVYAQNSAKVGVGLAFDSEVETAGIQVNAIFPVSERINLAPNLIFYFPEDDGIGYDSYVSLNFDGHFLLDTETEFLLYAIGGLNLTAAGDEETAGDDSETELGINLGIGGEYDLEEVSLFGNLKYVLGGYDRVALMLGVRFDV